MQAIKVLNLMEIDETKQTTWLQLIEENLSKGGISRGLGDIDSRLTAYLTAQGTVQDPAAAIHAIRWLGLLGEGGTGTVQDVPLLAPNPLDSLCKVMENKLQFKHNERDMAAMFHTIVGKFPDGTVERHTSRLLDFGDPGMNGDSAMSKTVGYTTGAAAELILNGMLGATGVVIPNRPDVYEPMLKRLQDFGIHWTESIEVTKGGK